MRWLLLALAGVVLAPGAIATPPSCASITEQPPGTGVYTVVVPPFLYEIWIEDNGYPGLQRQSCIMDDGITTTGPDWGPFSSG